MNQKQYERVTREINRALKDLNHPINSTGFSADRLRDCTYNTESRMLHLNEFIQNLNWLSETAKRCAEWLTEYHLEIAEEEAHEINWEKGTLEKPND